jgi:hypothetical protein
MWTPSLSTTKHFLFLLQHAVCSGVGSGTILGCTLISEKHPASLHTIPLKQNWGWSEAEAPKCPISNDAVHILKW